jgi:hypothetical protein
LKREKNKPKLIEKTKKYELIPSMKILFCQRAFALRGNWGCHRTLHTFANRTSLPFNQNLQKSAILTNAPISIIQSDIICLIFLDVVT